MEKLNNLAQKFDELDTKLSKLSWVQYTAGYDFGIEEAYKDFNDFMQDKNNFQLILDYKDKDKKLLAKNDKLVYPV